MKLKSNLDPFLMAYKFCLPRTVLAKKKKIKRTGTSLNVSVLSTVPLSCQENFHYILAYYFLCIISLNFQKQSLGDCDFSCLQSDCLFTFSFWRTGVLQWYEKKYSIPVQDNSMCIQSGLVQASQILPHLVLSFFHYTKTQITLY